MNAVRGRSRHGESLRDLVKDEIRKVFDNVEQSVPNGGHPHVTLIVGVNGTGKTTTIGKLASLLKASGKQPLVCAADTFRAAAVEQLEIWAKRADVDIVRAKDGSDPAAVVFDAIQSGKARGRDPILVDTAGRLHTRVNLILLEKIRRVAARASEERTRVCSYRCHGGTELPDRRAVHDLAGVTASCSPILTQAKGGVAVSSRTIEAADLAPSASGKELP